MENELEDLPSLLTVSEMADILKLKRKAAYMLIVNENIPVLRFGSRIIRVPRFELVKWMRKEGK